VKIRYKFLRLVDGNVKSSNGDVTWKLGEWKHEDRVKACAYGFHCSKEIWEAFSFVPGETEVECKGKCDDSESDKEVYQDMRIVKAWKWQKKDSVALSIYAAELCLKNFEKFYPDDNRPKQAIEAAKKWLLESTKENESAAESAAWSAWSAARSAVKKEIFTKICAWFDAHLKELETYDF
jgi:hypothetical protein